MTAPSVAILAVGDEILRGEVQEANAYHMAAQLNQVGANLRCILVTGDEVETIARWVRVLSDEHDFLIVCGGVGPTHDDVTMEGVARAFGVKLISHPDLTALIEKWRGESADEAMMRLTQVPQGTVLFQVEGHFPVVRVHNTFILPGVPKILRRKFADILDLMRADDGPVLKRNFISLVSELDIAQPLSSLAQQLAPEVSIGSYPEKMSRDEHRVRLTLTSRDAEALERACRLLMETFPHLEENP